MTCATRLCSLMRAFASSVASLRPSNSARSEHGPISRLHMRKIKVFGGCLLALFCWLLPLVSTAKVAISSQPREAAGRIQVAPLVSGVAKAETALGTYWELGRWQLDSRLDIVLLHGCSTDDVYGFWETINGCSGNIEVRFNKARVYKSQEEELDTLRANFDKLSERANDEQRSIYFTKYHATQLALRLQHAQVINAIDDLGGRMLVKDYRDTSGFFAAMKDEGHLVTIDGTAYELQGFNEVVDKNIAVSMNGVEQWVKKSRREIVLAVAGVAFGLALAIFLLIWIVRWVRRKSAHAKEKVQQLKDAAVGQVDKLQAAHQRHKVRSVMMDETIREMTRTALSGADAKSKEVLIGELRKAIESGNHELANALELALALKKA